MNWQNWTSMNPELASTARFSRILFQTMNSRQSICIDSDSEQRHNVLQRIKRIQSPEKQVKIISESLQSQVELILNLSPSSVMLEKSLGAVASTVSRRSSIPSGILLYSFTGDDSQRRDYPLFTSRPTTDRTSQTCAIFVRSWSLPNWGMQIYTTISQPQRRTSKSLTAKTGRF